MTCPYSIAWGATPTSVSRCHRHPGHGGMHHGPGLPEFPYQRISWAPGDRREFHEDDGPPPWPWPWLATA